MTEPAYAYDTAKGIAPSQSEVVQERENLFQRLSELDEAVAQLAARIHPVLRSEYPQPAPARPDEAPSTGVELADQLADATARLSAIYQRVCGLNGRIAL